MFRLLDDYILQLKEKKLSSNTIEAYKRDIKDFLNYLKHYEYELKNVNDKILKEYMDVQVKSKKANSSIIRCIISIKKFYDFLIEKKVIKVNPIIKIKKPKHVRILPNILTIEEVESLLNAPDTNSIKGLRDKSMLELMYATGLKVSELLNIKVQDVDIKNSYIRCVNLQGKERIIPLGRYAINVLEEYMQLRHVINKENLDLMFLNLHGEKMSRQGFWKIVKQYAKEASIKKQINSTTLRHSFAVHLLQNGADLKIIQELLGHSYLNTTQLYSTISKNNKISEVYNKTHPRA
ncbi:MAG: site-specific tyrosine recombinase XerD [Clostridiaceae bacterium]